MNEEVANDKQKIKLLVNCCDYFIFTKASVYVDGNARGTFSWQKRINELDASCN